MSYYETGPVGVDDALEWAEYHDKLLVDLVEKMESRAQSFDPVSLDNFMAISQRLRDAVHEQAGEAAARGESRFAARIPMTDRERRLMDAMSELLKTYAEILELRGIEYPLPPDGAVRMIGAFVSGRMTTDG